MITYNRVKYDESWNNYGTLRTLFRGKNIKFYSPNLKDENERVMIMISGEFGFSNPSIIFCSYPLSYRIRNDLKKGGMKKEILKTLIDLEILGKKSNPEMYLLCNTEESFSIEDLQKYQLEDNDIIAY